MPVKRTLILVLGTGAAGSAQPPVDGSASTPKDTIKLLQVVRIYRVGCRLDEDTRDVKARCLGEGSESDPPDQVLWPSPWAHQRVQ